MSTPPSIKVGTHYHEVDDLKSRASDHWTDILSAAGIPRELLDCKGHPCPKCGGTDRFAAIQDVSERGAVICRKCFDKNNGDGLATLMWIRGCSFPEALRWLADYLGVGPGGGPQPSTMTQPCDFQESQPLHERNESDRSGSVFESAEAAVAAL